MHLASGGILACSRSGIAMHSRWVAGLHQQVLRRVSQQTRHVIQVSVTGSADCVVQSATCTCQLIEA